jgi:small subunit ribosomal protein S15
MATRGLATPSSAAAAAARSSPSPLARLRAAAASAAALQPQPQPQRVAPLHARAFSAGGAGVDGTTPEQQPHASPSPQAPPPARPDLADRYLSDGLLSRRGRLAASKRAAVARFARFEGDVGSPEVQVALATERIRDLSDHFRAHKKDHHSRRGLQALLNRRRRLLAYLRGVDFSRFCGVLAALGLERDTYARQRRADSFRTGTALGGGGGAGGAAERLPRVALSARLAAARRATAAEAASKRRRRQRGGGRRGADAQGAGQPRQARASGAPMA